MNPIDDRNKLAGRTAKGTFAPGGSGGLGGHAYVAPVAEMRREAGNRFDKSFSSKGQALAGDAQAIRIILDRVLPTLRPVRASHGLDAAAWRTLAEAGAMIVQAAADGDLAPTQAAQIVTALGGVAKIIETTELVKRIEALEARKASAGCKP